MNRLAKRRVLLAWAAASLAAAVVSLIVLLGSHHEHPGSFEVAVDLVVGLSFAASGVIAWARRPENNTGRLLLVVGFTWFLGLLGAANDAVVSTIGRLPGTWISSYFGAHVGEQQYLYAAVFIALVMGACLPLYYYREAILRRFHRKPRPRDGGENAVGGRQSP